MTRRIALPFLSNLILVLACALALSASAAVIPVYFTDNMAATETSLDVTPLEQALLDHINAAQTTVAASYYDFNRVSIRDALIAAHNRGVTVRVVADDEARHQIESYTYKKRP